MKRIITVVGILLLSIQGLAAAEDITWFQNGDNDIVANLAATNNTAEVRFNVPAECHIRKATVNVSSQVPNSTYPGYPKSVRLMLNDSKLWEFNGTDFGALGLQDKFYGAKSSWKTAFGPDGGANTTTACLPMNASVINASIEVNCNGPYLGPLPLVNFTGAGTSDEYGLSVSSAGDINGDGYNDMIMGAPNNKTAGVSVGKAYIYFSSPTMDNNPDVILSYGSTKDEFGGAVSGAGDVNNDGFDDVIVGAKCNDSGGGDAGRAYIFFGGSSMDSLADVVLTGSGMDSWFGESVAGVGDVNNDGYDDVAVGVGERTGAGYSKVYMFLGGTSMDNAVDVTLTAERTGDYFGQVLSSAGDVNNDGYHDVLVGTWRSGIRAYVFFGGANMDNTADVIFQEPSANPYRGISVSDAGDVNKDGYGDVMTGTNGAVYIYFGGSAMDNAPDVKMTEAIQTYEFGTSLSGVGDFNDDGYDDVIVGSPRGGINGGGRVDIYLGGASMDGIADFTINGSIYEGYFGCAISEAGDVNRDGHDDFIVGGCGNSPGGSWAGSAYIEYWAEGVLNPSISVGGIDVLSSLGYFHVANRLQDISSQLGEHLNSTGQSGSDNFGNSFADVSFRTAAQSIGNISLGKVNITYASIARVPDFADKLNSYIAAHKMEKDAGGNISVPFTIKSQTPGRVKLQDLSIIADLAPALLKPIPDLELAEDTRGDRILDLYEYMNDDYTQQGQLHFGLASVTNGSKVAVEIVDHRYLSVDASEGPQNDNWTGFVRVGVNCTDSWGSISETNPFNVHIFNVQDAPVITSVAAMVALKGKTYYYQVLALDGDRDKLSYSLAKCPQNMTINEKTGNISWTPMTSGNYEVSIVVTDGTDEVYQDYTLTVQNRLPRIVNTTAPVARTGEPYTYDVKAVDDDPGDVLTYELVSAIPGMTIDSVTGRIEWTPEQVGTTFVSIRVDDGTDEVVEVVKIPVVQGNRVPQFQTTPVTKGFVGLPYSYNASATDPDGDSVNYTLFDMPQGMTVGATNGKVAWTPNASGSFTVRLNASDGKGKEAFQDFVIQIFEREKATVEITLPTINKKVSGTISISGKALKGTLKVTKVQVRVDSGDWADAQGTTTWDSSLDTSGLKNGIHTIQVRAYDGMDWSDNFNRTVVVDNSTPGGKGIIPGFEGLMAVAALAAIALWVHRKKNI